MSDLKSALAELEEHWNITPPMGSSDLPPRSRFALVLIRLSEVICPRKSEFSKILNSRSFEVGAIATDAFGTWITESPFVYTQIVTKLSVVGLEKFCEDPGALLEQE